MEEKGLKNWDVVNVIRLNVLRNNRKVKIEREIKNFTTQLGYSHSNYFISFTALIHERLTAKRGSTKFKNKMKMIIQKPCKSFLISLFIVCGYALVRLYISISNIDYSSNELNSTVNGGTANVR